MPTRAHKDLVTLDQAAEVCQVTPKTIRRWISDGRVTGYRLGPRLLRVDRAELDQLVEEIPTA